MTPGLDAGPCLAQESTADRSRRRRRPTRNAPRSTRAKLVLRVIDELAAGTCQSNRTNPVAARKPPRLTKDHGAIDRSCAAHEIKNQIRAVPPLARAFTFWHLTRAPPCDSTSTASNSPPANTLRRAGIPATSWTPRRMSLLIATARCSARNPHRPTRRQTHHVRRRLPPRQSRLRGDKFAPT